MAREGHDMFIGGKMDDSFGPIVYFGFGGVYIEIFRDAENVLCPAPADEIAEKLKRLKTYAILTGTRGAAGSDISAYILAIEEISHLMHQFPQIRELDLNPVRIMPDGMGVMALDARILVK
jgi:acyl-CoA synthetase (NDP forming)